MPFSELDDETSRDGDEADDEFDSMEDTDNTDAFSGFDTELDDDIEDVETDDIDLTALMSDCTEIAKRYGLQVEEDVCKFSETDKTKIISACIKFFCQEFWRNK